MERNRIELLAPAGSYEAFEAALGAGADAVYIGGSSFGARAYAKNFERDDLIKALRTAHIHGKKVYLTVNTLLKNRELSRELYSYLMPYYEEGLDGVIVQDIGVMRFIRENFAGLPLHASTQMTVTGPEGMKFLEREGVSRVVPARELGLEEIRIMHQASPLEIECFIHGALCYSYSGQCLMSSILGGRSGNRGKCAQPCRLPYGVGTDGRRFKGKEEFCPLSLKDICTLDILPDILAAGAVSLKIEGRMKQPAYTAGVTRMYRKYLDILLEKGPEHYEVNGADRRMLLEIFSRGGSCSGYYKQQNGPSMMAFTNEKKTGKVLPEIIKRKEKIYGNLILFPESPVILEVSCRGRKTAVSLGEVQYAKNQPLEENRIRMQMDKLGDTEFEWGSLDIEMDKSIFVPMKLLNEVRRAAVRDLEELLIKDSRRIAAGRPVFGQSCQSSSGEAETPLYVSCETKEQAEALCEESGIQGIYIPYDVMKYCMDKGVQKRRELYLALPHIVRGQAPEGYFVQAKQWLRDGMKGFLVRNLEAYGMLEKMGLADKCVLDASMYTWNEEARAFWQEKNILRDTIPLELNEKEILHRYNGCSEFLIYGYFPLMISAQCVRKNVYGCDKKQGQVFLNDRYEKHFVSVCCCSPWKMETTGNGEFCYNIIYNSIPYGLLEERDRVKRLGAASFRLAFTMENPQETVRIFREFLDVYRHGKEPCGRSFTKGHFKRGAE